MRQSHKMLLSVFIPIRLDERMNGESTAEQTISDIKLDKLKFIWNYNKRALCFCCRAGYELVLCFLGLLAMPNLQELGSGAELSPAHPPQCLTETKSG